jgi:hypothetical protein
MPPTPSTGPGHSEHKALLKNAEVMQLVAVSVETGGSNFQHYKKGVYNGPCRTKPNHTVTIVGYDKQGRDKYWIVKDSWGDESGDQGYIKMKRNIVGKLEGLCGIAICPTFYMVESNFVFHFLFHYRYSAC